MNLLLLALAGALGTLARYGMQTLAVRLTDSAPLVGTLAVNAVGCFLFGVIWPLADDRMTISPQTRMILLVGFMGAFTTFSTFAFETGEMLRGANYLAAAGNVLAQNVLGVALFLLGTSVGRLL